MKKKLLSYDDLYNFYVNQNKTCSFSSKETGQQIFVQVPAQFEVDESEKDNLLLFCTVKLMHSGENRNKSSVTDEALVKASKQLAYKPILANFMEYTDENTGEVLKDFTSHDMELTDDGVNYIEKQVGCFTADEPYFEIEEETGHNFLYGKCAIPTDYTDAAAIIQRKGGTKISVELAVNELSYDVASKVLILSDVDIMGATLLGKNPNTLENVEEGMKNARLDISDFSADNNSLFSDYESKMNELQERLEKLETTCFSKEQSKEGGINDSMTKFEELLAKYSKSIEDVTFDYAELSDEELEAKFAEMFSDDSGNGESDGSSSNDGEDNGETGSAPENNSVGDEGENQNSEENLVRSFELSHEDIRYGLYQLLEAFEESDNTWYWISDVYDSYFVYESYDESKIYKQSYTKSDENNTIAFEGERIELFRELLTASEKAELEAMRQNYAALQEFKENVEKNELHSQKEAIINSDKYSVLTEKDDNGNFVNTEFAQLVSDMDNYSLADFETKIKVLHSDYVAEHSNFSFNEEKSKKSMIFMSNSNSEEETKKKSPYGGIFEKYNK